MKRIAIIGAGFVGTALGRYFETQGIAPAFFDPPKGLSDVAVLENAEVIFIAVPTPFYLGAQGYDDSFIREALKTIPGTERLIVLKSTVQPGTTERLQAEFPQHRLLFNPEFLTESRADFDMQQPNRQIIGYTDRSREDAQAILNLLPRAPFQKIVHARVAETVKCVGNSFYALKVAYANQLHDLCAAMDVDYTHVKECVTAEPWMGTHHWETVHKGYRGYGGKCLPKDIRMTIQLGDKHGVDLSLLKRAEEYNNALVQSQGLDIKWEEGSPKKDA
jgi:UDPglucose 6-dehydrogenase